MGFLYDVNAAWNFGQRQFLNARVSPYLVVGAGGLTADIGGGLKVMNVLGPMGFRADVRGRTIPNFNDETINWPK